MKHKLLFISILISGMSMVACSDDKPSQQGASNCLTNPTMPGCSLQKAALAQVPGSPEQAAALLAANKTGSPALNQVQPPGTPPGGTVGIPVASVSQDQLKAQAAKVAARLKETSDNPLSSYWQAPDETGRAPASLDQAVIVPQQQVQAAPVVMEEGGETAR